MSTPVTMEFADRLQELIAESGKTIKELAREIGISSGALSKYQNDAAEAGIDALVKIANYFCVSTDYLIGRTLIKTEKTEVRSVCAYTGLSEDALLLLISINNDGNNQLGQIEALNELLSEHLIRNLIYELAHIRKHRLEICTFLHNIQLVIDTGETEDGPIACTIDELKDRALIRALKLQSAERFSRFEIIDTFTKLIDNLYMTIDWNACFSAFVTDSFMGRAAKEAREIGDIDFAEFLEGIGGYSGRYS